MVPLGIYRGERMEQVMSFFKVVGWQIPLGFVLGAWAGDWLGRKFPRAWSWMRLGLKNAGDAVKDAVKE